MQQRFTTTEPSTGQDLATWNYMNTPELMEVLENSRKAFTIWRNQKPATRAQTLSILAERLSTAAPELGAFASREMGKPIQQAVKEVEKCALACRYYATHGEELLERLYIRTEAARSYVSWQPMGTILSIMPWNFPYWQVVRFVAPALMAGNTIVIKHAENTTGCAFALQKIFDSLKLPTGSVQTIIANHADIPQLIQSPITAAVTLTGSEHAGRAVAAIAGAALKKHVLELGGSDAYVILKDADIETAATICVESRLINSGQSCIAAKRFILDTSIYNDFIEVFIAKARTYRIGPPDSVETQIGPLAKVKIRDEVVRQVQASVLQGGKITYQSECPQNGGYWYPVTVVSNITPGMALFDEDVFGPVAAMIRAPNETAAIALANQSRFGLGAAIFSRDIERAEKIAEDQLEAGLCGVNTMIVSDPRLPFGGIKASGFGRELGSFGLREFVNIKTMVVR